MEPNPMSTNAFICSVFLVMLSATPCFANDPVTPEDGRLLAIKSQEDQYRQVARKEPTPGNLLESLALSQARGDQAKEVEVALELLSLRREDGAAVIKAIRSCYENNTRAQIRVRCALVLFEFDREQGLGLAEQILQDNDFNLLERVLLASGLLQNGILIGYVTVSDGLVSSDALTRKVTLDLLNQFRRYNGKEYGPAGEVIDIPSTISRARERAQKIVDDVAKADQPSSRP
jgi:hypothetical protein